MSICLNVTIYSAIFVKRMVSFSVRKVFILQKITFRTPLVHFATGAGHFALL
jgi:hypothetical protein